MASRILDFPLPLRPVMELNDSSLSEKRHQRPILLSPRAYPEMFHRMQSIAKDFGASQKEEAYHPEMTVRTAYDLKPCSR